jgi:hypothetical protein
VITFKSDNRIFIASLVLVLILTLLGCVALQRQRYTTSLLIYFWLFPGFLFLSLAFLKRELVVIRDGYLIIKNRLNILPKRIMLKEITKVKAIDKELSVLASSQNIFNLILWNKKFKRIKNIEVFGAGNSKLFTIDGRAIENSDYVRLIRQLKNK